MMTEESEDRKEKITPEDFERYCVGLENGHSADSAADLVGRTAEGMRVYKNRDPERVYRVRCARAAWNDFHLKRLKEPGNERGAAAAVRASLGALASVDKRYRKEVHVGGTINNTLVIADPRPSGLIGNPDRYALPAAEQTPEPQPTMAQADAQVIDAPAKKEKPPQAPVVISQGIKKPRPIL